MTNTPIGTTDGKLSARQIWLGTVACLLGLAGAVFYFFFNAPAGPSKSAGASQEVLQCALPPVPGSAAHPGMAWVPAGIFDMGDTVYPEEKPVMKTKVKGFWMDRTEVTNDQFAQFVQATGHITLAERAPDPQLHAQLPELMRQAGAVVFTMPKVIHNMEDPRQWWRYVPGANWRHPGGPGSSIEGRGAFPVVHITYADALAYARWRGHELPREAEWDWAARGGAAELPSQHDQPEKANTWQGVFPMANSGEDGFMGVAPVGCYAGNAYGLHDMVGNVWELTSDSFVPDRTVKSAGVDPDSAQRPPPFRSMATQFRVIKGGSFLCAPNYCMRYRAGSRQPQEEDLAVSHLGFRTLLRAPPPP